MDSPIVLTFALLNSTRPGSSSTPWVRMSNTRDTLSVLTILVVESEYGQVFQPVFISVDPARDSTAQMKKYLADFHPRIIGLTGDYSSTKSVCKAYRVYFSTPPDADPKGDYLVDHSIYIYFMDPNGKFVEAFGQNSTSEGVVERVKKEIGDWEKETGRRV